jgi:ankyrin repeat protein
MRKNIAFYLVVLVFSLFVYPQTQEELNCHLFEVVKFGNLQQVKMLVERGADVNARDVNEITVLMCAAANGNMDIVKYIVSKGASLNLKDIGGHTVLYYAASRNQVEIIKFLIKLVVRSIINHL